MDIEFVRSFSELIEILWFFVFTLLMCITLISNVEPTLHSWNKPPLVMVYYPLFLLYMSGFSLLIFC